MSSKKRNSVLWQINLPDNDATHYLMGTMHLRDRAAYTYAQEAEELIKNCNIYAGEMNLDEAAAANMHQYFLLPDGWRYEEQLTKAQYAKLQGIFLDVTGYTFTDVDHLIPMALHNMISESFIAEDYALPLDQHLWNFAKNRNMQLEGLESADQQIVTLKSIPLKYQLLGLKHTIRNVKKHRINIIKLSQLYAQAEIHKLYKKSKKSTGRIKHVMIYERNRMMVDEFTRIATQDSLFASVGAAHLAGEKGMLHLLKGQGATIKEVINR